MPRARPFLLVSTFATRIQRSSFWRHGIPPLSRALADVFLFFPNVQAAEEPLAKAAPELKIDVDTKFPEADIFGLKLINGRPTKAIVEVTNNEDTPVRVSVLGGALVKPQALPEGVAPSANIVVNLTTVSYESSKDALLQPGESRGYPYNFVLDLQPRELRLDLMAIITNSAGQIFQITAHSGTATVVDPPINIFDPQM